MLWARYRPSVKAREQKRFEAEQRQARLRARRALQQRFTNSRPKIARLEQRQAALTANHSTPLLMPKRAGRWSSTRGFARIQHCLPQLVEDWETSASQRGTRSAIARFGTMNLLNANSMQNPQSADRATVHNQAKRRAGHPAAVLQEAHLHWRAWRHRSRVRSHLSHRQKVHRVEQPADKNEELRRHPIKPVEARGSHAY